MSIAGGIITEETGQGRGRGDRKPRRNVDLSKLFDQLPPHAIEAEMAVLGSIILEWRVAGEVVQVLQGADDFYKPAHAAIYQALVDLYDNAQSIDMVQLHQHLADRRVLDQVGGLDYLVELASAVPSASSAAYYAGIVRDKAILRRLIDTAGCILQDCYTSDEPLAELLDRVESDVFKIAQKRNEQGAASLGSLLEQVYADLLERAENHSGKLITGIECGFYELDDMLNGLQPGEMLIVAARPSMGKAQPLDANVLTTAGFKRMGDLVIGDELASVDGQPSRILGIYPQGQRQVYRITFADGRSAECCDEHLWRVHYREWETPRILTTAQLREKLDKQRYRNRLWIETFTGEFGCDASLPLDPWLLGVLIGDGSLNGSSVRFSSADADLVEHVAHATGPDMSVNPAGGYDYRIARAGGAHAVGVAGVMPNPVKSALQSLGLWGKDACHKFIPAGYLNASRESRRRLLTGLLDTDGWVERFGAFRLATSSEQLAKDVVALVRSLGGTACYKPKQPRYTYRGESRQGQTSYVCNLQVPDTQGLFTLERKQIRLANGRQRQRRLNIASIEPTRVTQTQCIAVSHPDHLYITDDFVVTHNTAFALNLAEHIGLVKHKPVGFFSLEMSKEQLAQRLLCSRSRVDSHKLRRNLLNREEFAQLSMTVEELTNAPVMIDDTPGLTLMQLRAKARRMKDQYGIEALFIDYLQLMSAPSAAKEGRQNEVSSISRGIKALARELRVPVVCLSQLNRAAEQREGHRPRMSDLRESGSIEQDADVVMMLHRESYYHRSDPEWEANHPDDVNTAEVIVAKQRNGPTGTVRLFFDGGTTSFRNLQSGGSYQG